MQPTIVGSMSLRVGALVLCVLASPSAAAVELATTIRDQLDLANEYQEGKDIATDGSSFFFLASQVHRDKQAKNNYSVVLFKKPAGGGAIASLAIEGTRADEIRGFGLSHGLVNGVPSLVVVGKAKGYFQSGSCASFVATPGQWDAWVAIVDPAFTNPKCYSVFDEVVPHTENEEFTNVRVVEGKILVAGNARRRGPCIFGACGGGDAYFGVFAYDGNDLAPEAEVRLGSVDWEEVMDFDVVSRDGGYDVFLAGNTTGDMCDDPSGGEFNLMRCHVNGVEAMDGAVANGTWDAYVAKLRVTGLAATPAVSYGWSHQLGTTGSDAMQTVAARWVSPSLTLYLGGRTTGEFTATANFDDQSGGREPGGSNDGYVVKLDLEDSAGSDVLLERTVVDYIFGARPGDGDIVKNIVLTDTQYYVVGALDSYGGDHAGFCFGSVPERNVGFIFAYDAASDARAAEHTLAFAGVQLKPNSVLTSGVENLLLSNGGVYWVGSSGARLASTKKPKAAPKLQCGSDTGDWDDNLDLVWGAL